MSDPRFLRGGGWIDVPEDLDQIALSPIWPVDERQDSDEEREQRNEREEDLVRDRAGKKGAVVVGKAQDDGPAAPNGAG
jgi:hypothetical protein